MMKHDEESNMMRLWQQDKQNNKGWSTPCIVTVLIFIVILLSSCKTQTRIEYRDVYHYTTKEVHDTIRESSRDSIHHEIRYVNDTVFDTKVIERTRWRDKIKEVHDTCYRDSIKTNIVTETKEVVKIPKIFIASMIFSIITLIFAAIKLILWLKH